MVNKRPSRLSTSRIERLVCIQCGYSFHAISEADRCMMCNTRVQCEDLPERLPSIRSPLFPTPEEAKLRYNLEKHWRAELQRVEEKILESNGQLFYIENLAFPRLIEEVLSLSGWKLVGPVTGARTWWIHPK